MTTLFVYLTTMALVNLKKILYSEKIEQLQIFTISKLIKTNYINNTKNIKSEYDDNFYNRFFDSNQDFSHAITTPNKNKTASIRAKL